MALSRVWRILSFHKIVFTRRQKFPAQRQGDFSQQKKSPKTLFARLRPPLESVKPSPGAGFQRNTGSRSVKRSGGVEGHPPLAHLPQARKGAGAPLLLGQGRRGLRGLAPLDDTSTSDPGARCGISRTLGPTLRYTPRTKG